MIDLEHSKAVHPLDSILRRASRSTDMTRKVAPLQEAFYFVNEA